MMGRVCCHKYTFFSEHLCSSWYGLSLFTSCSLCLSCFVRPLHHGDSGNIFSSVSLRGISVFKKSAQNESPRCFTSLRLAQKLPSSIRLSMKQMRSNWLGVLQMGSGRTTHNAPMFLPVHRLSSSPTPPWRANTTWCAGDSVALPHHTKPGCLLRPDEARTFLLEYVRNRSIAFVWDSITRLLFVEVVNLLGPHVLPGKDCAASEAFKNTRPLGFYECSILGGGRLRFLVSRFLGWEMFWKHRTSAAGQQKSLAGCGANLPQWARWLHRADSLVIGTGLHWTRLAATTPSLALSGLQQEYTHMVRATIEVCKAWLGGDLVVITPDVVHPSCENHNKP